MRIPTTRFVCIDRLSLCVYQDYCQSAPNKLSWFQYVSIISNRTVNKEEYNVSSQPPKDHSSLCRMTNVSLCLCFLFRWFSWVENRSTYTGMDAALIWFPHEWLETQKTITHTVMSIENKRCRSNHNMTTDMRLWIRLLLGCRNIYSTDANFY